MKNEKSNSMSLDFHTQVCGYSVGSWIMHGKTMPGRFPKNMNIRERTAMIDRVTSLALNMNLMSYLHDDLWK